MDDDGSVGVAVGGRGLLDEAEHRQGIVGDAVVWPVGVVVLKDESLAQFLPAGFDLGVSDLEGPDGVGGLDVLVDEADLDEAKDVGRGELVRPVQIAFSLQD